MLTFNEYLLEQFYIDTLTNWQLIDYSNTCNEVFDSPSKIEIIQNQSNTFNTKFEVNGSLYMFMSEITDNSSNVLFYPLDGDFDLFRERKDSMYVGKVFASVLQSVKLMLDNNKNITILMFVAENKKLENIYKLIKPVISKRFSDWKFNSKYKSKNGKVVYKYSKGNK